MGYTHYWNQSRDFTREECSQIRDDFEALLKDVQHVQGIPLAEARRALPRYANILDIPMDIPRSDRWCMPWVSCYESSGFDVNFCVDGKGYIEHIKTGDWYRFETRLT